MTTTVHSHSIPEADSRDFLSELLGEPQIAEFKQAWLELYQRTSHASPELHPDCFGIDYKQINQDMSPRLITVDGPAESLQIAGFLPKRVLFPYIPGYVTLLADGYELVGDMMLAESDPTRHIGLAVADLLGQVRQQVVCIENLAEDDTFLRQSLPPGFVVVRLRPPKDHWYIKFPSNRQEYWSRFSSKSRNTMRRQVRSLSHEVKCFQGPEDVAEFIRLAQDVSASCWQHQRKGRRVLGAEREVENFETYASLGLFRSYVLSTEGRPVAYLLGHQSNGMFHYKEPGYDPQYADFSPGTVLLYRIVEDLLADPEIDTLDFGEGEMDYKSRFGNVLTKSGAAVVVQHGSRAWAKACGFLWMGIQYRRIKRIYRRLRGES